MNLTKNEAHAAFFPLETSPLGLLLTHDAYGEHVTAFIDGDYLRLMIATHNTPNGLAEFNIPDAKRLYAVTSFWPEEWHPRDVAACCRMAADCIDLGWDRFKIMEDDAVFRAAQLRLQDDQ